MITVTFTVVVALLATDAASSRCVCGVLQADSQETQSIHLAARFVDEDGQPILNARVELEVWSHWSEDRASGDSVERFDLESDDRGRVELKLPPNEEHPRAQRGLQAFMKGLESWDVALPAPPSAGPVDLGDIVLARPGSTRWLARKDDAELETEYRGAVAALERQAFKRRPVDTCLTEMVRRGGARWQDVVGRELARERAKQPSPTSTWPWIEDLELLTALRRIQGKPDPLAIQLAGVPELECTFPQAPTIGLRMRNVDVDGDVFQFRFGCRRLGEALHLPADANRHFAVEVRDASGTAVRSKPMEPLNEDIAFDPGPFEKGVDVVLQLPLDRYVKWPGAGEFQVRVLYHNQCYIAGEADCAGWITSATTWFTVHVIGK